MLRFMRNQRFVKALMWIVILSFVGWLGFELGYGGGGRSQATPEVGEIAGEPVYWTEFRREIGTLREYYRRQGNTQIDDFDLDEQVWQQTVQRIILRNAVERAQISVTADELAEELVNNPPSGFERVPEFQRADGQGFDREKYRQFLASMTQERWFQITGMTYSEYESRVLFDLKVQKLQQRIDDNGWITDASLRQAFAEENETIRARVIAAPISLVPDSLIKVSDDEIRSYYQTHLNEFKQRTRARFSYVVIPRRPSPRDVARAAEEIRAAYRQLQEGADFAETAQRLSEDEGSARDGGDLGTFGRGRMVPAFDSVAFSLPVGEFSQPFHTQFGWHIVKVERRVEDTAWQQQWGRLKAQKKPLPPEAGTPRDSVQARHILIKDTEPSFETADSLQAIAEKIAAAGPRFATTAAGYGLTVETTPWFTEDVNSPVPAVQDPLRRLVRWSFSGTVGSVASPAYTRDHIVVARLADRSPEGPQPLREVRDAIALKVRVEKRVDIATQWLTPIAKKIAAGQPMEQAVQGTEFTVVEIGPIRRGDFVPEVSAGASDGFTGAAFALTTTGQTTGALRIPERGSYIVRLLEKSLDWSTFDQQREQLRQRLARQRRQSTFRDWETYARKSADVKDYRDRFYNFD